MDQARTIFKWCQKTRMNKRNYDHRLYRISRRVFLAEKLRDKSKRARSLDIITAECLHGVRLPSVNIRSGVHLYFSLPLVSRRMTQHGIPRGMKVPNWGSHPVGRRLRAAEPIDHTSEPLSSYGRILKVATEPWSQAGAIHELFSCTSSWKGRSNSLCRKNDRASLD